MVRLVDSKSICTTIDRFVRSTVRPLTSTRIFLTTIDRQHYKLSQAFRSVKFEYNYKHIGQDRKMNLGIKKQQRGRPSGSENIRGRKRIGEVQDHKEAMTVVMKLEEELSKPMSINLWEAPLDLMLAAACWTVLEVEEQACLVQIIVTSLI